MSEPHYLEPITYQRVDAPHGPPGWIVPPEERERWGKITRGTAKRRNVLPDTRPLPELIDTLAAWIDVSGPLETNLRDRYEDDPGKVSRIVFYIIEQAEKGVLHSPGGLLMTKLQAMH